jgi:hypothetical protein
MKFTDGYWDENGDFIEFNADIKLPWWPAVMGMSHRTTLKIDI